MRDLGNLQCAMISVERLEYELMNWHGYFSGQRDPMRVGIC